MFPNLKNRKFIDILTNESLQVKDQFENIAILSNDQRVDVKRLLDNNYYDEHIDPKDFLSQQSLVSLAEKIKSIPSESLNNIKDDDSPVIMQYDPEEEKRMLMEKAKQMTNPNNAILSQMDKFKDLIDEEDIPVVQPHQISQTHVSQNQPTTQPIQITTPIENSTPIYEDPMVLMFKNIKKNTDFKISIDIENKIPRPDFIEMMEDSYEVSIIDYLSEEFTKQILENPSIIKNKIKEEINKIVYKKNNDPAKNIRIIPTVSVDQLEVLQEGVPKKRRNTIKKEDTK